MKLPRDLSGSELVKYLCKHLGYRFVHQKGSHVILESEFGHRIPVPQHNALKVGTLSGILSAVAYAMARERGISSDNIAKDIRETLR